MTSYQHHRYDDSNKYVLYFCSCQTVKTKEEKEVLEHFAGVVSKSAFSGKLEYTMMSFCTTLHVTSRPALQWDSHAFMLSFTPPLSPSLLFPHFSYLPFFSPSFLPPIPPLPPVHNDEHEYVQGDLCGGGGVSCWEDPVQLCSPDHPKLIPCQLHYLTHLCHHPPQLPHGKVGNN